MVRSTKIMVVMENELNTLSVSQSVHLNLDPAITVSNTLFYKRDTFIVVSKIDENRCE